MKVTLREYEIVFLRDVLKEAPDGRWETGGMLRRLRGQFKKLADGTRQERMTKRMTKAQRAQVVELLRCGADAGSLTDADVYPYRDRPIEWAVWEAKRAVQCERPGIRVEHPEYRYLLLEAAARVEEGSWP